MEEPFGLRPAEIAELTDAQIVNLYGRDRDEKTGVAKPVGADVKRQFVTPEEKRAGYIEVAMAFGKTREQAESAWAKMHGG